MNHELISSCIPFLKAANSLDAEKTYSLDEYAKAGIKPQFNSSQFDVRRFVQDEYNSNRSFPERKYIDTPSKLGETPQVIQNYTPQQRQQMEKKWSVVPRFTPKMTPQEYRDQMQRMISRGVSPMNPALDFKISENKRLEVPAGYSWRFDKIYERPDTQQLTPEYQNALFAHEGTHAAVDNIINAGYKPYGVKRYRPEHLFNWKDNEHQGSFGYNIRYDEWPTAVVQGTFTNHKPVKYTGLKNNIRIADQWQHGDVLLSMPPKDATVPRDAVAFDGSGYALPYSFVDKFFGEPDVYPYTPMLYSVDKLGGFNYPKHLNQYVRVPEEFDNNNYSDTALGMDLSTAPENIYRIYDNIKDIPYAWREFKIKPDEFLETRENVQRMLRPLYANAKPYVYAAGDYDKNGKIADNTLTVSQLVRGCMDPKTGKQFQKQHWKEIQSLHPELIQRLSSIHYPSMWNGWSSKQFDKEVSQLEQDFPEYMTSGQLGPYPEGLSELQHEFSITPGFDIPSDVRTMPQMQDIIDRIIEIYRRQRFIDNFQDPRGINRNWA